MKPDKISVVLFLLVFLLFTPFSSALEFSQLTILDLDGDTLVARKDPGDMKYFYHPDHLGSTDLITDQNGNVVEETTYKPYGTVIDGGATSDFLYTGKEKDSGTGLYYYGARYYDPFFRHFTQPDQNIPDVYNPQSLNRYSYVLNNPYKYVDPSGESPLLAIALISGTISAGISAYSQYKATGSVGFKQTSIAFGAGAVAGLTGYGIGALAGSALGAIGGGALGGAVSGEAGTFVGSALSGESYSFDPSRAVTNAAIGAVTAGIGAKLAGMKTQKYSDLSKEGQQTIKQIETAKSSENLKSLNPHTFENKESLLPKNSDQKYYTAYDVKVSGQSGRGTNRVVTGKGGERYYTPNHYKSFTRIRGGRSRQ